MDNSRDTDNIGHKTQDEDTHTHTHAHMRAHTHTNTYTLHKSKKMSIDEHATRLRTPS